MERDGQVTRHVKYVNQYNFKKARKCYEEKQSKGEGPGKLEGSFETWGIRCFSAPHFPKLPRELEIRRLGKA